VLMTNPPFGSDIPITDPQLLDAYRDGVARNWRRKEDGAWILRRFLKKNSLIQDVRRFLVKILPPRFPPP
jgi:hypothetical protein